MSLHQSLGKQDRSVSQPLLHMELRICMCAHIAKDVYAHISCASCKRVPIKCIRPDAVEYVPARQRLQSRDPGGEESPRYNQSTEVMVKSHVCCRLNMHQPSPQQNRSAMADLSRTDRLQPGRGCTSQTSQRLHNPERPIQRFTVPGERESHGSCISTATHITAAKNRAPGALLLQVQRLL